MKLTKPTQVLIKDAIDIATTLSIESIVIDKFSLRGENKEDGIVMIMPTKNIELEFDAIGLGRINLLKNRMTMLEGSEITFDTFKKDDIDITIVSSLNFKQSKTKLSFKCADPKMINAPKAINDPVQYDLHMTEKDTAIIIKAVGTMTSEVINFSTEENKMMIKISDKEGDMFSHEIDGSVRFLEGAAASISKSYKAKTMKTILSNYMKKDDNAILPISITKRGVMKLDVLNIGIYIFPER